MTPPGSRTQRRRNGATNVLKRMRPVYDYEPMIRKSACKILTSASEHAFRVRHIADGVEFPVTVALDPEAVERVARLTRRRVEPGGAFWRGQAERLLSAYVWSEGRGPADGRLTVRDVTREDLDVVAHWELD